MKKALPKAILKKDTSKILIAFQPLVFLLIGQNVPKESIGSASSLYILFCIGGGSLSSVFLGPVWLSHGWSGITIICTISVLISLLIISIIMLKEKDMEGRH